MAQRYRIVADDDDHHYVIPAENMQEWEDYDWEANDWAHPEWAQAVNGWPGLVTFTDPVID